MTVNVKVQRGDLKMGRILIFFLLITIITAGCATKNDVTLIEKQLIDIDNRLDILGRKNTSLTKQLAKLEKETKSTQKADFLVQFGDFQTSLNRLSGRLEENDYKLKKLIDETNKEKEVLVAQLSSLEKRVQGLERLLAEQKAALKATEFKLMGPKGVYQEALNFYKKSKYKNARELFEKLLKEYPNSSLAGNAQFWIGEAYFSQKRFEEAILAYQKAIKKYPKNTKIPGALLKQGLSFAALGDKDTAKILLKQLIKKYPKTEQAKIAQRKLNNL